MVDQVTTRLFGMVRTGGVGLLDGRWEGNTGLKPDDKRLWDSKASNYR